MPSVNAAKERRAPIVSGANSLATLKLYVGVVASCMQYITSYLPSACTCACRSNQHCKLDLKNTIVVHAVFFVLYDCWDKD